MNQDNIGYSEVARELVLKLEELAFGKLTYKGVDGRTFYQRVGMGEPSNNHDWAKDYITVAANQDGSLSVSIDTSKMIIAVETGMDREAKLNLIKHALKKEGVTDINMFAQSVKISEQDERLFWRPKLEFTITDGSKAFQLLGEACKQLLYVRVNAAYGESKNEQAAREVIDTYSHGYAAVAIHKEFAEFLDNEKGIHYQKR